SLSSRRFGSGSDSRNRREPREHACAVQDRAALYGAVPGALGSLPTRRWRKRPPTNDQAKKAGQERTARMILPSPGMDRTITTSRAGLYEAKPGCQIGSRPAPSVGANAFKGPERN